MQDDNMNLEPLLTPLRGEGVIVQFLFFVFLNAHFHSACDPD